MAISTQALFVTAQIRIAAYVRKVQQNRRHKMKIRAGTIISKYTRSMLAYRRKTKKISRLERERDYRIQYLSAVICQKMLRCFIWKNRLRRLKEKIENFERQTIAKHRKELITRRRERMASLIYRQTVTIQSITTITYMFLKNTHEKSSESFVELKVYVPMTQETFHVHLTETEVRNHLEEALKYEGSLSWNEMLKKDMLKFLTHRLVGRELHGRRIILFARKGFAEKGNLKLKTTWKFQDDVHILLIHQSSHDVAIRLYNPVSCNILIHRLHLTTLNTMMDEVQASTKDEKVTSRKLDSRNGKKSGKRNYIKWILHRLCIKMDDNTGKAWIEILHEPKKVEMERVATKFQSIWRQAVTKRNVQTKIKSIYEKSYDRASASFFYVNTQNGRRQWHKPVLLYKEDDIDDPVDEWKPTEYIDKETAEKHVFYTNNFTGQRSWLTEDEAARLVQRKYRVKMSKDLLGPIKLDFCQVARAVTFVRKTEEQYKSDPSKLSNKVNYALFCHCIKLDYNLARKLYKEAMEKNPGHPVIARAYGMFILANCEAPMNSTFQRACRLFQESHAVDPQMKMFQSAIENFFYWGVLIHPKGASALLNYALLHQCVLGDIRRAENIYRRALSVEPSNRFIVENFELFTQQMYPGGTYECGGPPFSVLHRSNIDKDQNEAWGEWKRMYDPMCKLTGYEYFWYNSLTKQTSHFEPNWDQVWSERLSRSKLVSKKKNKDNIVEYHDSTMNKNFTHNHSDNTFSYEFTIGKVDWG